jgi:hypothetical protein
VTPEPASVPERARSASNFWSYLDPDPEQAVQQYNNIRERLVFYFKHYGFADPENLASEVVFRVNRKCLEGIPIDTGIMNFCYGVARYVRLETWGAAAEVQFDGSDQADPAAGSPDDRILLDQLLGQLKPHENELIRGFYLDDNWDLENVIGGSRNALRIRVCRAMDKLREFAGKSKDKSVGKRNGK